MCYRWWHTVASNRSSHIEGECCRKMVNDIKMCMPSLHYSTDNNSQEATPTGSSLNTRIKSIFELYVHRFYYYIFAESALILDDFCPCVQSYIRTRMHRVKLKILNMHHFLVIHLFLSTHYLLAAKWATNSTHICDHIYVCAHALHSPHIDP